MAEPDLQTDLVASVNGNGIRMGFFKTVKTAVLGVLVVLLPAAIHARQAPPNTIELWGGAAGWSGGDVDFEGGPGMGWTFLFHMGMPVQAGFDLAFARVDVPDVPELPNLRVDEFSGSLALRYRLPLLEHARPFLGVRAGYTRLSAETGPIRLEWNGSLIGGSAGLDVPLRGRVMLTATGEAMYYNYSDASLFVQGIPLPQTGGWGWRYWGRLGLSFRWWN